MILFSVGLPSCFAEWCDAVAVELLRQETGAAELIAANSLDEFALGTIRSRSTSIVVVSRQLFGRLRPAIAQAGVPFIVALDDPRHAVEDLVVGQGGDLLDVTRAVARSCASVGSLAANPHAMVLRGDRDGIDPLATAEAIARHFALAATEADLVSIIDGLAEAGATPTRAETSWWNDLDERQRLLVNGAVGPYAAHFSGADLGPITWERELFYLHEEGKPGEFPLAARPVDVTGRARILVFGPYLNLPSGAWTATLALGFSPAATEISYAIEIFAGTQLAVLKVQPGSERYLEATLQFSVDEDVDGLIEVRIRNERAAFEGQLALSHVTLTPQAHLQVQMRDETLDFFASALGGSDAP
jgi:hypothetical protein